MPVFVWEGKRPDGKVVRGELEASNIGIVKLRLKREDIVPTKIRPKTKGFSDYLVFLQGRVKEKEIVLFIRQFGTMLNAGVPVVRALDVLAAQQSNKLFKKILQDIKTDVEGGSTLADAFSKYPRHFDELFVNMIAAGETGGVIDQALDRLGNYREKALGFEEKGERSYGLSLDYSCRRSHSPYSYSYLCHPSL
ncbi:Type II secretion system protein F [Candidatus Methanoperedenaceae archaeon GB37]|nr:Type II secretion system protein F [Candidatus Methanoperedenaceae archaeon GB37]